MKRVLLFISIFFSFNVVFSQTLEVKTITEALSYTGNRASVKKLIVTGTIKGSDYSEGSEWREFRTLDMTFPNIEEVEILTDQNIPNNHRITNEYSLGLFQMFRFELDDDGRPIVYSSNWLKKISAPNVKYIGNSAFHTCLNLESVNFPVAETIGIAAFGFCESLVSVDFPNVKFIDNTCFGDAISLNTVNFPSLRGTDWGVFIGCNNLTTVNFGTSFTEPTSINFNYAVFGDTITFANDKRYGKPIVTENITLTLGEYVFPEPDTIFNIWQNTYGVYNNGQYKTDYIWKNIKKYTSIKEEIDDSRVYNLGDNKYKLENVEQAELFDIVGKVLGKFYNYSVIDLDKYTIGAYLLRYVDKNKNIKTYNLIR